MEELQRNRFRVEFSKEFVDGVFDGGHNLFAIGLFVLSQVVDARELKRIKTWDQLDEAWAVNRGEIEQLEFDEDDLVAVELIYPPSNDEEVQEAFDQAAFDLSLIHI